jgi:hypothetical protein
MNDETAPIAARAARSSKGRYCHMRLPCWEMDKSSMDRDVGAMPSADLGALRG